MRSQIRLSTLVTFAHAAHELPDGRGRGSWSSVREGPDRTSASNLAAAAAGISLSDEHFAGFLERFGDLVGRPVSDPAVSEALAVGYLAGRIAHRPRTRTLHDPTTFVMDRELVVQDAEGESILRLPWCHDDLFVGRPLHDIAEMPATVHKLCVENYSAALAGERRHFEFTSYGHRYAVDAVPVYGEDGRTAAVLAVARPAPSFASAAIARPDLR